MKVEGILLQTMTEGTHSFDGVLTVSEIPKVKVHNKSSLTDSVSDYVESVYTISMFS